MWLETTTYVEDIQITENTSNQKEIDGWNDADQANKPIYCPNHDKWYMELCERKDDAKDQEDMEELLSSID